VLERRIGAPIRVGLTDGRIVPLSLPEGVSPDALHVNDVIYVDITEGKKQTDAKATLRVRPHVQGATIVLENKTGRILAMVGGFSYPLSQLNRTTQAQRQPGSSIKPVTYLTALHKGLQPNTMVLDAPVTLPSIPGVTTHSWTPKNYDGQGWGSITLRRALENSKNLVTARLLDGGIDKDPTQSLDQICALAVEAKIYPECIKNYPFVLGAQPLKMIDLAQFYSAIANEGLQVTPYSIESIERRGQAVYKHQTPAPHYLAGGDRASFFQLRTILEGVVARGTAASLKSLTHFIGGKTGTTENENDAWFASFTNDVTVVVWVGYDNARGKRVLGHGETGSRAAAPIAQPIIEASWAFQAPKVPLPPPSAEAARHLKALPIDYQTGQRLAATNKSGFTEYFKLDGQKKLRDTQYALTGRHAVARGESRPAPEAAEERQERPAMQGSGSNGMAMGRMPPSNRVPSSLRELFGF
jgi:membrane carboxypeptidase/penicillin-binding protein